jgi:hypothetical protein
MRKLAAGIDKAAEVTTSLQNSTKPTAADHGSNKSLIAADFPDRLLVA